MNRYSKRKIVEKVLLICLLFSFNNTEANELFEQVSHHYAKNDSVKIHYVTMGDGPLIVMLHGFPDFWYTWRDQMKELSKNYKVAAVDLRGYNKSDKPDGVDKYSMRYLVGDVVSVIKDAGYERAIIIGHDWGGAIAWQVAINIPQIVEKLIVISTPHPRGLFRELKKNKEQQKNSEYANEYQKEDSHKSLTPERLADWVADEEAKEYYINAFQNSDIEAMLNYYKASFPKQSRSDNISDTSNKNKAEIKLVKCPTLAIFGMKDKSLLPAGWNGTWDWIENNFTLVSVQNAGHFVHHDDPNNVTKIILQWFNQF